MNVLFYDLAAVAVLLLFVFLGRRRGFILTLCGLLAVFVAFIGASVISNALCEPVAQMIEPVIQESIVEVIQTQLGDGAAAPPDLSGEETGGLPVTLEQALELLEGSELFQTFRQSVEGAMREGLLDAVTGTAASLSRYIARELARLALFALAFVVVLIGWKLLSHALDLAFKLPVLSTVNRFFGGVLGLVKGGLLVFILVWLLRDYLPPEALTDTYVVRFFAENSPLSLVAGIF